MYRLAKLQLIGPLVLSFSIMAGELASYALALKPSSQWAWYLNLEIFSIFQRSHYVLSDRFDIPYFQLIFVAIPILLLVAGGTVFRRPLAVAAASNLSLVYAVFLAYAWYLVEAPPPLTASLTGSPYLSTLTLSASSLTSGPRAIVFVALLISALLSFGVSHFLYFRAMRRG